jgi:uncharacterized protein
MIPKLILGDNMKRYLEKNILEDPLPSHKMAFISGPRQVGKTTVGESLVASKNCRFNWDVQRFRLAWIKDPSASILGRNGSRILLDEIHKDRLWKSRIKGLYDEFKSELEIIVTGSARLDVYRKGGDSLLGRYVPFRLHPFSVAESADPPSPAESLQRIEEWSMSDMKQAVRFPMQDLSRLSGFPEPLFAGQIARANRWSKTRLERLLTEDVRDLRLVRDLKLMQIMVELLPERVGAPFSVNNLRETLSISHSTASEWLEVLESLYVHFIVRPFSLKKSRLLLQEPKLYLWDPLGIENEGALLENMTALHLYKACQFWNDSAQGQFSLHYLRNKEKEEVDFCIVKDKKIWMLVECKSSQKEPAAALIKFAKLFECKNNFQLVSVKEYDRRYPALNIRVMEYDLFLSCFV